MDWKALSDSLAAQHPNEPQKLRLVELAVSQAREAIEHLTRMGHPFHLAPGPQPADLWSWPRVYWQADGRSRPVYHPHDLVDLGPSWFPTLEEAQQARGRALQFAGRGGIRDRNLPVVWQPEKKEMGR